MFETGKDDFVLARHVASFEGTEAIEGVAEGEDESIFS